MNQADEHVKHAEYTEHDDAQSSEGDPHVDFTTLAVNYNQYDWNKLQYTSLVLW